MTTNEATPTPSDTEAGHTIKGDEATLVEALAEGWSYRRAGERAGLSERSVARRMDNKEFKARVAERSAERSADRVADLRRADEMRLRLSIRAAEVLGQVLEEEDVKVRLVAAKALLPPSPTFDIEARVAELEHRIAAGDSEAMPAAGVRWPI